MHLYNRHSIEEEGGLEVMPWNNLSNILRWGYIRHKFDAPERTIKIRWRAPALFNAGVRAGDRSD
jgi:hypothetical protein